MVRCETIYDKMDAVALLMEHGYDTSAAVIMRTVCEHIVNVMLIDFGLYGAEGRTLSEGIKLLESRGILGKTFHSVPVKVFTDIRRLGNLSAHNSENAVQMRKEIRSACDSLRSVVKIFEANYPDEPCIREFYVGETAMIDVSSRMADRRIQIKTERNHQYVSADEETGAVYTVPKADAWEIFDVRVSADGYLGFRCSNGKWLSVNYDESGQNVLLANGNALRGWECFCVYKNGNDYYIRSFTKPPRQFLSVYIDEAKHIHQINCNSFKKLNRYNNAFHIEFLD